MKSSEAARAGIWCCCPHCSADARFVDYRKTPLTSLMGKFTYERCYYYCTDCNTSWFLTDEEFRLRNRKTPGAEEVIALAEVVDPFDEVAHRVLTKMSGLNLSQSTVQGTTEIVGDDLAQRRAAEKTFGQPEVSACQPDSRRRTAAYMSLVATGVRFGTTCWNRTP